MTASKSLSMFFLSRYLKMCPSMPEPPGVVDCYSEIGMCARDNTCAPLLLNVMACVEGKNFMKTRKCQTARSRMRDYQMCHGMLMNCTCITSPVQCSAFKVALGTRGVQVSNWELSNFVHTNNKRLFELLWTCMQSQLIWCP